MVLSDEEGIDNLESTEISKEKLDNDAANDENSDDELDDLLLKPTNIFTEERTESPKVKTNYTEF